MGTWRAGWGQQRRGRVSPKEDGDLNAGGLASWGDWSPGASWRIYPPLLPALFPPLPVSPWLETGGEGKLGWWGYPWGGQSPGTGQGDRK